MTDLSKIKDGDQVKIEYLGLTGWQTVQVRPNGKWSIPLGERLDTDEVKVIEHKPAPRKIEVELPEPKPWPLWDLHAKHGGASVNTPTIVLGKGDESIEVTDTEAKQYALTILALVHEARS